MLLHTFLSFLAALWGLSASVLFALGAITMRSEDIKELSSVYYGCNISIAKALVSQRADYTCGSILLFFAFLSQICSLLPSNLLQKQFFQTPVDAILPLLLYASLLVLPVLLLKIYLNASLIKKVERKLTEENK